MSGLFILLITTTFAPVFKDLPVPVLAVLVFDAGVRRIPLTELLFTLHKRNWRECVKLGISYLLTISLTPTLGILLCLLLSALVIIRQSTDIHMYILGEIEVSVGEESVVRYVDISLHPESFVVSRIVPLRIKGHLEYYNASRLSRRVEMLTEAVDKLSKQPEHQRRVGRAIRNSALWIAREGVGGVFVVLDWTLVESVDSSAAWQVKKMYEKSGDRILFCGGGVGDLLDFVRSEDIFPTMVEALEYVKLVLYGEELLFGEGMDEEGKSVSSTNGVRWHTSGHATTQFTVNSRDDNQISVRSVRSLRSLHLASSELSYNGDTSEVGQISVRSTRREVRPVHVRNLFQQQISNVKEEGSQSQIAMDSLASTPPPPEPSIATDSAESDSIRVVVVQPGQNQDRG